MKGEVQMSKVVHIVTTKYEFMAKVDAKTYDKLMSPAPGIVHLEDKFNICRVQYGPRTDGKPGIMMYLRKWPTGNEYKNGTYIHKCNICELRLVNMQSHRGKVYQEELSGIKIVGADKMPSGGNSAVKH